MTTLARANLSTVSTTSTPIPSSPVLPRLPEELVASATFLLKRLGFSAKEQTMKAYEQTGLHPYHHGILTVLGDRSSETQGAIADALGYDRGQHIVSLTTDGEKTLRRLRALSKEIEDEFLSPLSNEERANLHALLYRLAEKHDPRCAAISAPVSPV